VAERLQVEGITKVYSNHNRALEEVSFLVEPGTFLVLLGPSGSGKTTLLRSLAGIERLTSGRITIGDTIVADDKVHLPPERRNLSMVFQDYALWPHLRAADNVAFALHRHGHSRSECRRLAMVMMERVGLEHLTERFPSELSGGEQQRVALARALVGDTGLVLCDEPLSNLDADLRERMRVEIASLVRDVGATTVYITHDQLEAFALADRVGVLERGRLVQIGTPEEVYGSPVSPFVARFTGLAVELEVQVEDSLDEETTLVRPLSIRCSRPIEARSCGAGLSGRTAWLAVRPTAVRLHAPDAPEAQVRAVVTDVAFRGRDYELAVDIEGGLRISGIHSDHRLARATALGVSFDRSGCLVYPSSEESLGRIA
jgi:iron(III) transport system ATP-binding protein